MSMPLNLTPMCACELRPEDRDIEGANTDSFASYCNQDEENDPSPEYEEYLSCSVCGDNGK
jgi:hypothetical protein